MVDDPVLQDPDKPGALARPSRELFPATQGLEKRLLNQLGGQFRHADAKERKAIKAIAMGIHPALRSIAGPGSVGSVIFGRGRSVVLVSHAWFVDRAR